MNDFPRQWSEVGEEVVAATRAVGESGWYVLGSSVSEFENELAKYAQIKHAVGVANGLDAIEIALRSLGLTPGQKVLTTPLSAFATTLAIVRAGGVPVFVDTNKHGLMDLQLAREALAANPDIRHLVPVHLFGHAIDLVDLSELAAEHDLRIVEDMAQAIGAKFRGTPVGSVGQAAAVSFYPTKNLGALGDAGALLTNEDPLFHHASCLRDYGQASKYEHVEIGLNSRLDELHAAILTRSMLPRLPSWTQRRREIAAQYLGSIHHPDVIPMGSPEGSESVWHLFPAMVGGAGRDSLAAHLKQQGIHSGVHYPKLISDQDALRNVPYELASSISVARRIASHELSLPIHPYMNDVEIERVIAAVNSWPRR
jgi:dTDP-3-amino-3,4,6-trideoxy-alpha-D-glucose transaminase